MCWSCVVSALLPVQCAVCVSPMWCLHYCQHRVPCLQVLYCVCTTASTVCCVCKSYVVFALLPAQGAMFAIPMLCLHYCQRRVPCLQVLCCVRTNASAVCCVRNSCVLFAQCTVSAVCRAGATISPLIIAAIFIILLFCVCTTVCCMFKSCVVFVLLPAQCVVCVSPMLCLQLLPA